MNDTPDSGLVRVNFSVRGFAKLINRNTVSSFTPDCVALESFGRFLTTLNLQPEQAITFASISEFRGIDYVGYIIEKERLDKTNATWIRLEEYRIIGSKANSFKDSRVVYGETYRYRIRSVIKFTTFNHDGTVSAQAKAQNLVLLIQNQLKKTITQNTNLIANISPVGSQSKSDANNNSSVSLGAGVTASVDSRGLPVFKFDVSAPNNQPKVALLNTQLSSLQASLATNPNLSDADLATITNSLSGFGVSIPSQVKYYTSQYLASCPNRNWKYVVANESVLPPPPSAIKIVPCTPLNKIYIYWLAPADDQRDLFCFNIYRRTHVGQPWDKIAEHLPLNVSTYEDTKVTLNEQYIYALTSLDLHGYESFLSTQVQAQLNASYKTTGQETLLKWISGAGARPDEADTIFKKFYTTSEQIIARDNIKITPSKTFTDYNANILLRIKSLDTHETKELVFALNNKNANSI